MEDVPSHVMVRVRPSSVNSLTAVTSLLPSRPFCEVMSLSPSIVTVVLHFLPSVVVSLNGSPSLVRLSHLTTNHTQYNISYLNLSSMLFIVVLVIMVQLPEVSLMVITGVEAMAAFLNMKPTLSTLRKFS